MDYRYPLAQVNFDNLEIDAVIQTLYAGRTTCGPNVHEFEQQFAFYVGASHATMVNSGSSADLLVACGLGEPTGPDEILIPAVTWPTQVWSCLTAGYTVRLIDVDPETLQIDLTDLKRHINERTRAVFLTHLLGNVVDIDAVRTLLEPFPQVDLIEDCCESLGSFWRGQHVGTFGKAGAFSFFFSHLINTMEGGMVVTNDANDDKRYRLLRSHGWEPQPDCRFWFPTWGFNLRPTEVQGAFGKVQMDKLARFRAARKSNAEHLSNGINEQFSECLSTVKVLPECDPTLHGFPLMVNLEEHGLKDKLCAYLERNGIETRPVVAGNLAKQQAIASLPKGKVLYDDLPGADLIHERGFYIGLSSFYDSTGTDYVLSTLDSF